MLEYMEKSQEQDFKSDLYENGIICTSFVGLYFFGLHLCFVSVEMDILHVYTCYLVCMLFGYIGPLE